MNRNEYHLLNPAVFMQMYGALITLASRIRHLINGTHNQVCIFLVGPVPVFIFL